MIFLILPHQLFDIKYFEDDYDEVVIYEHPQYFTKYNFNYLITNLFCLGFLRSKVQF